MIRILADSTPGEIQLAAVEDDTMLDYHLWRPAHPDGIGDVYRARVRTRVASMAGAFVALPECDGFLPDSEGGADVAEGRALTVRVTRAAQGGKGPRLTAKLDQLEGRPGLVTRGPTPLDELAARYPDAPIAVGDPALAAALRATYPHRITLASEPLAPWADAIGALAERTAALPGGISATFEPTSALVAIDLDLAAAAAPRQGKQTAQLGANVAALAALARQIRLRNLSGAILIDFAGLSSKRRARLGPALADCLASDPLRPRLLGFTALGLAEILRPRLRPPLHECLAGPVAAGLSALRHIDRIARTEPHRAPGLAAALDVARSLAADPSALADLARRTGRSLMVRPDPALPPGTWRLLDPT